MKRRARFTSVRTSICSRSRAGLVDPLSGVKPDPPSKSLVGRGTGVSDPGYRKTSRRMIGPVRWIIIQQSVAALSGVKPDPPSKSLVGRGTGGSDLGYRKTSRRMIGCSRPR